MQRIITGASTGTSARRGGSKKAYPLRDEQDWQTVNNGQGEG